MLPGIILLTILLIVALVTAGWSIKAIFLYTKLKSYKSCVGKITESSLSESGEREYIKFTPKISYEYSVEGQTYNSSNIGFGDYSTNIRSVPEELVHKFKLSEPVKVYYPAGYPEKSIISKEFPKASIYILLGAFVFIAISTTKLAEALSSIWH